MISDIVNKLWDYTMNYSNIEIVKAAYETLSCFNHDQVSRFFPDIYRDDASDRDTSTDVLVLASGAYLSPCLLISPLYICKYFQVNGGCLY